MLNEKTLWPTNLFGNLVFSGRALRVNCQHKLETWTGYSLHTLVHILYVYMPTRHKIQLQVHTCTCVCMYMYMYMHTHNLRTLRSPSERSTPYKYLNYKTVTFWKINNNNNNGHRCKMLIHVCALHNTCQVTQSYVVVRAVSVPQQVDTVLTQLTHVAATQTRFTNAR